MEQNELRFQNHIIDSYKLAGGYAKKWASEWQAHAPDLICSLPEIGLHLLEVKHIPAFSETKAIVKNALRVGQRREARLWRQAGGEVWAAVIGRSSEARGSALCFLDPLADPWDLREGVWVPYMLSTKFDVKSLIIRTRALYDMQEK
jgi:hypothetical protein